MTTFNRVLWITVGAILTLAGLTGTLASLGVLPFLSRDRDVITSGMDERWRSWGSWAMAITIVVGFLIAVLGVLLLKKQFSRRGGSTMANLARTDPVSGDEADDEGRTAGRTRISASTLNHALSRDLQADGRVRRAAVRLTGAPNRPNLRVQLAVTPDAEVSELRRLVDRAVQRFSVTSGLRPTIAEVVVKVGSGSPERVH